MQSSIYYNYRLLHYHKLSRYKNYHSNTSSVCTVGKATLACALRSVLGYSITILGIVVELSYSHLNDDQIIFYFAHSCPHAPAPFIEPQQTPCPFPNVMGPCNGFALGARLFA